jgi:enamine deaminase RidA (YjgF/YER057c/UK114 family)
MPRDTLNPTSMYGSTKFGFSHATRSTSRTLLHLAGQVAWDKDYRLVGPGDIRAQAAQALAYLVNHTADDLKAIGRLLVDFYGGAEPAANTVVGVSRLAMPEFLCEIEVTAAVD